MNKLTYVKHAVLPVEEFTVSSSLFWSGGRAEAFVPGVDFRAVRELISMVDVLDLIGFESQAAANGGLRGPCPIHGSRSAKSRSFAVNVKLNVYRCFTCGSAGNHLDLYAAFRRQGTYQAALELCAKLHRDVPWIRPQGSGQKKPAPSS
jgi:DNA primase